MTRDVSKIEGWESLPKTTRQQIQRFLPLFKKLPANKQHMMLCRMAYEVHWEESHTAEGKHPHILDYNFMGYQRGGGLPPYGIFCKREGCEWYWLNEAINAEASG